MLGHNKSWLPKGKSVGRTATCQTDADAGIRQVIFLDKRLDDGGKFFPRLLYLKVQSPGRREKPVQVIIQKKRVIARQSEKIKNAIPPHKR